MTLLDSRQSAGSDAAVFSGAAPDASISLVKDGSEVSIVLRGEFDERAADQLAELVEWLTSQGPIEMVAVVEDEPMASDGFAFRRLTALARVRTDVEARGGTLQVHAAPRLTRTLTAMRLTPAVS